LNIDHGILPAGTNQIKSDLNLSNSKFGTLGSVLYLGETLGSALASVLLQNYNPKTLLIGCLILNILSLIIFTVTDNFVVLIFCRIFSGIFQVFFSIF